MKSLLPFTLVALLLSACGGGTEPENGAAYDGPVTNADWTTNADEFRGQEGLIVAYRCPPNPDEVAVGSVWGSGTYSDDSSVCMAGVHAGAITHKDGGVVVFEVQAGQDSYQASMQNGVQSSDWGSWGGSFRIVQ